MHMAELFGSVPQFWPSPGPYGFMQTPMPMGNRPFNPMQPMQQGMGLQGTGPFGGPGTAVPTASQTPGDPYTGNPTTNVSTGLSAAIVPGPMGTFPSFTGTEIAIGVTAPALLTAVAMRRGQPLGPTNDQEIEDFIYDALDLLPGATDVEVRCENGKATVTGSVPHKRLKRDVGEIAWAIPSLNDVQNNITVATRRRSRSQQSRENELAAGARKG
jgi:BON domain